MRTPILHLSALVLPVALASCASIATRSDFDPDAHFSEYRSFDWMPSPDPASPGQASWETPFLERRIKKAVIAAMEEKGFVRTDQQPDVLVACYGNIRTRTNVHVYGPPYYAPAPADVERFDEGTVVIDLVDPQTRKLVWRGWGVGNFDGAANPETATG